MFMTLFDQKVIIDFKPVFQNLLPALRVSRHKSNATNNVPFLEHTINAITILKLERCFPHRELYRKSR